MGRYGDLDRKELKERYLAKKEMARLAETRAELLERQENNFIYQNIAQQRGGRASIEDDAMMRIRFNRKGADRLLIPDNNIFADHLEDIRNTKLGLGFSPENYPLFDALIYNTFLEKPFRFQNYPGYDNYAPLRENIAVLRNFIYGRLFPDGSFDENDVYKAPLLAEMANAIGVALERDHVYIKRPFTYKLDRAKANVLGTGAAEMYNFLLKIQNEHSARDFLARPLDYILHPITALKGGPKHAWNLPPIEETPFSAKNLTTPLHGHGHLEDGQPLESPSVHAQTIAVTRQEAADAGSSLWSRMADEMELRARRLQAVSTLSQPVLDESVDIAREILEKLKVTLSGESARDWLAQNADEKLDDVEGILESTEAYEKYLTAAARLNPAIVQDKAIQEANLAIGKLAYIIKQHAVERCRAANDKNAADELGYEINSMPEEWKKLEGVTLKNLISKVDAGYATARKTVKAPAQAQLPSATQPPKSQQLNEAVKKGLNSTDVALLKQAVDAKGQAPVKSNLNRPSLEPRSVQQQEGWKRG